LPIHALYGGEHFFFFREHIELHLLAVCADDRAAQSNEMAFTFRITTDKTPRLAFGM
jgi:hypothetical protein